MLSSWITVQMSLHFLYFFSSQWRSLEDERISLNSESWAKNLHSVFLSFLNWTRPHVFDQNEMIDLNTSYSGICSAPRGIQQSNKAIKISWIYFPFKTSLRLFHNHQTCRYWDRVVSMYVNLILSRLGNCPHIRNDNLLTKFKNVATH